MRSRWSFIIIPLAIALLACSSVQATEVSQPMEPLSPPNQEPTFTLSEEDIAEMTPIPSAPNISNLQKLIERAREDLARRLSISVTQVNLVESTEVVWSDSSLGCPEKGMVYADILTPGFLIILDANNAEYEYHSSRGTELVFCQNPVPPVQDMPGDT